jgi:hypothetical protein
LISQANRALVKERLVLSVREVGEGETSDYNVSTLKCHKEPEHERATPTSQSKN